MEGQLVRRECGKTESATSVSILVHPSEGRATAGAKRRLAAWEREGGEMSTMDREKKFSETTIDFNFNHMEV